MARLDELLGGGIRPGDAFLVLGPPFCGKRTIQELALREALGDGRSAVVLTTRKSAEHASSGSHAVQRAEHTAGSARIRYVDACTRRVGVRSSPGHTKRVEPGRLGTIIHAVNASLAGVDGESPRPRLLLVDSLTSLVAHNDIGQVYAFVELLIGCAKAHDAAVHFGLDAEAHPRDDIALLRFLADDVLALRVADGSRSLHLSGVHVREALPWIEYRFDPDAFEITGSFSATRVR